MSISRLNPFGSDGDGASSSEALRAAEQHLAELRKHHPAQTAEARGGSGSALRPLRRLFERERERLSSRLEDVRQAWEAPYHPLGWLVARVRLLQRPTIGAATISAVLLFAIVAVVAFAPPRFIDQSASKTVRTFFFGGVLTGVIVALWGDLFRLPYQSRRIRRRIVRNPWSVLPTTARKREAELMARDETRRIVPRRELYDELLPGVLDRSQRDTQVVVGEPGSGKTTALVDISKLLARIGIVPVVVPLWGKMPDNLVDTAKKRFVQHARSLERSETRLEELWHWLRTHRRLVILVDDLDRIAPDGDRGFLLRRALGDLAGEGIPAVVTTRPAGIPAGVAASAISLEKLGDGAATRHVLGVAREQPGTAGKAFDTPEVRGNVELWIKEGRLAEVPFYLELLARLVAAEHCEELAPASTLVAEGKTGRVRRRADGHCEWDPLWVRFRLLERFHDEVAAGTVHRWLGIDVRERTSCVAALGEAALAQLVAIALEARPSARTGREKPARKDIEKFLDANDRPTIEDGPRLTVSAHEVVNTAERLRMLDRDPDGGLHFSHRILQAYLAGRYLADELAEDDSGCGDNPPNRLELLLDSSHPERMTANMTLIFAALCMSQREQSLAEQGKREAEGGHIDIILRNLVVEAELRLPKRESDPLAERRERMLRLDPSKPFDPEDRRADPDDALGKLTTAAEIAAATGRLGESSSILSAVERASGATKWTKLNAILAIAALKGGEGKQWARIWEFARDPDHGVCRAASEAIADDAFRAYSVLECGVEALILRAALKSARDLPLDRAVGGAWSEKSKDSEGRALWEALREYGIEDEVKEVRALKALGWVLPAVVSGLREHPAGPAVMGSDEAADTPAPPCGGKGDETLVPDQRQYDEHLRHASRALDRLVSLAFQSRFPELEASVAQGFKNDAMRHADNPKKRSGPGLVESNRQLVTDVCLDNARHWYSRTVLHQALALYTVAGSDAAIAFDAYGRTRGGAEPHPLVRVAAEQARRVVVRHRAESKRWKAFVWADEGDATSRRQPALNPTASMLVADVTLLLNLNEIAPEDRQRRFARMSRLPYCLHESRDRLEILGAGCPDACAYKFCPLREAPVDEPDGQRTISRAFCRGMQGIAADRVPPWQKGIKKKDLKEFWREMEKRART